jgi:hypothetical protein
MSVQRVRVVFHAGIPLDRAFLDFYWSYRRGIRAELLRRCLIVGRIFPGDLPGENHPVLQDGKVVKVSILIQRDDIGLESFLAEFGTKGSWDGRDLWVRETVLRGYLAIAGGGNASLPGAPVRGEECPPENPRDPKTMFGGLFQ